jgi:hypothetical protein
MKLLSNKKGGAMLSALTVLIAGGCAHHPSSELNAQMAAARSSLEEANRFGAQQDAAEELQMASDKFAKAQKLVDEGGKKAEQQALRLAQQAQLDAQYAVGKAQLSRKQRAASTAHENVEALRREVGGT